MLNNVIVVRLMRKGNGVDLFMRETEDVLQRVVSRMGKRDILALKNSYLEVRDILGLQLDDYEDKLSCNALKILKGWFDQMNVFMVMCDDELVKRR